MNPPEQAREHFATIRDPIGLVRDAIGERHVHDPDECASFLLERLWKLALIYDPKHDKAGPDFAGFASYRLRSFGVTDYLRHTHGRTVWTKANGGVHTYKRDVRVNLSLDYQEADSDGRGLGTAVAAGRGDPPADSNPALARLAANRAGRRAGDLEQLGIPPTA